MRLIMIFLIALWTQPSFSKTIFEPSLSAGYGEGEVTIPGFANSKGSGTVTNFGFRYGITRQYVHVAGIIEGSLFSGSDLESDLKGFGGIGIGWEWNIPLRTYLIAGAFDFDTDFMGFGAELSYFIADSFWLGFRYLQHKSEVSQSSAAGSLSAELELNTYSLVFSFPIEFSYPDHWFRKTDWQ